MKRKIRSLLNSIHHSVWLGLLTFLLMTAVLPVAAQTDFRFSIFDFRLGLAGETLKSSQPTNNQKIQNPSRAFAIANERPDIQNSNAPSQLEQGIAFYEVGRFSEAVTQWQQAVRDFEAQGDRINQAVSLNYLSQAYQDLGQWQDAQKAISQSLYLITTNQQQTTNNKLIFAQALNTKGSLQLAMGQTEAALDTWKQAENAYAEAGDETGVLGSRINQAQALQTLGLYRRAQTSLEQVNETLQTKPDSLLKATGLRSLGVALQVVGDLQKSQEVLEQSLAIAQRLDSSPDTSATLFSLGNTVKALQDYQNAETLYQEAAEKATNSISKLEAQLNQLSLLLQTKQWEAARTLLPQIQSQLTQLPPSRAAVYAQVNLAESLIKIGNGAGEREQQGNRDVQAPGEQVPGTRGSRNAGILPQNSQRRPVSLSSPPLADSRDVAQLLAAAVQQARMLKDPRAESYALGELGQLYEGTQQLSDAQKLTQEALSLAQSISASDIAYRWQWQLGRILKQKDNITGSIAAYTEAVNTLQSLRTDLVAINPDVQFTFRDSVEPIYRELVELLLQPLPNQGEVPSQENLIQARKVIESLQLAELDNFFREACLNAKPEQIDRVDPAAAIIYPIILPDRLAVILSLPEQSSNELRLRYYQTKLPENEVEGILKQLLQSLNPAFSNKQRLRFSQQVYDWLIRPAEAQLAQSGVKTLVFVLDGPLRNLPMAALHDGQQYLVEKYSIALSQGLQLLEPRSLVRQRLKALMGGLTEARQGFSALPAVNSELNQISSEVRSEVLLNQQFTEKSLEKQINQAPFPIIHLATHAQFSSKAEDTFLLTWDGRINVKDFDQLLRARERQNTNPIELFVLSACQTATGDNRATLGLAGLAVRSGARSTLATLWSVRDESTAKLMVEFYHQLLQTEVSKAEALRQAQLTLLKQPQYKHPYYWAPFVLVGNWL